MRLLPHVRTGTLLFLTLAFLGLLVTRVAQESPGDGSRRTVPLRENVAQLRSILLSLERDYDALHEVSEGEQQALMQGALGVLTNYLLPHLSAEEAVFTPALDRPLQGIPAASTAAMKREHDIMRRWIGEMEAIANAPMADHNAFARRGEKLLGLIEAHFEVDEEVLYPVLDRVARLSPLKITAKP